MKPPLPIFDDIKHIELLDLKLALSKSGCDIDAAYVRDYTLTLAFLKSYNGSTGTFNAYRREVERLLHWCKDIACKRLNELKRDDIEDFIRFCMKPPTSWIGVSKVPRFITKEGIRVPNKHWRLSIAE
jgi:hypothetical protein